MLAVGRGLMSNPKMILLDEPTLGLAPVLFGAIADVIKQLHSQGNTILLVEEKCSFSPQPFRQNLRFGDRRS